MILAGNPSASAPILPPPALVYVALSAAGGIIEKISHENTLSDVVSVEIVFLGLLGIEAYSEAARRLRSRRKSSAQTPTMR